MEYLYLLEKIQHNGECIAKVSRILFFIDFHVTSKRFIDLISYRIVIVFWQSRFFDILAIIKKSGLPVLDGSEKVITWHLLGII